MKVGGASRWHTDSRHPIRLLALERGRFYRLSVQDNTDK
jgi:hypothetical protein